MIDLHSHSTASDGRLSPEQLVREALQAGVTTLALTDHDTLGGLAEFNQLGQQLGLETISGVEVSAEFRSALGKGSMHIVGLFVEPRPDFKIFLGKLAEGRRVRNPKIIAKLRALGLDITLEEVELEAGVKDLGPGGGAIEKSIGRPHFASVLVRKGYVKNKQEAFDKYLAEGASGYSERFTADPVESIRQIHAAGGVAVLAHPTYLNVARPEALDDLVAELAQAGLDGIEVYYSSFTPEETARMLKLAEKNNLAPSGGSDFHGESRELAGERYVELGRGRGNLKVPPEVLVELKRRRNA